MGNRRLGNGRDGHEIKVGNKLLYDFTSRGRRNFSKTVNLEEYFYQRPALKAVNELAGSGADTAATFLAYTIANKNFSVIGTNMTTALCTFSSKGGITLNTAGASADQAILSPSLSTGLTQWSGGSFLSQNSPRMDVLIRTGQPAAISNLALTSNVVTITTSVNHNFSAGQSVSIAMLTGPALFADANGTFVIASVPSTTTFTYALTHANITSTAATGFTTANNLVGQTIWAGLKLTNTSVAATDANQVFLRQQDGVAGGALQLHTSRGGTLITTSLVDPNGMVPMILLPNQIYRLTLAIRADLTVVVQVDGVTLNAGLAAAPINSGITFIPYVGTQANLANTKAIDVLFEAMNVAA